METRRPQNITRLLAQRGHQRAGSTGHPDTFEPQAHDTLPVLWALYVPFPPASPEDHGQAPSFRRTSLSSEESTIIPDCACSDYSETDYYADLSQEICNLNPQNL